MTDIFWFEQTAADLPEDTGWLSTDEAVRANGMRFAKRRNDWLLGRWTAKRAVTRYWDLAASQQTLASVEIRAAASGAPRIFLAGEAAPVAISLSHRAGRAACAVAPLMATVGCDLEWIEPRSDSFVLDYFTCREQALVAEAPVADEPLLANLLWSAKESVLKALGVGLRLDTRDVEVSPTMAPGDGWRRLEARCDGRAFRGWWQSEGGFVRTLVCAPPARMLFANLRSLTVAAR